MQFDIPLTLQQLRMRSRARAAEDMRLILSVALFAVFASAGAGAFLVATAA